MSRAKLVGGLCFLAILASLVGRGGKVHYPSYYVLNVRLPTPSPAPAKAVTGLAAVRESSAPWFLRAGPIAYRQLPEQLGFYNDDRWAVDPRSIVANVFLETQQSRGVFQSVHFYDGRSTSQYLVTGTLDHLEDVGRGRTTS